MEPVLRVGKTKLFWVVDEVENLAMGHYHLAPQARRPHILIMELWRGLASHSERRLKCTGIQRRLRS
eukprot:6813473-Pyramimonas_sp.AAC.1